MKWLKPLNLIVRLPGIAAMALALTLVSPPARAQNPDTLTLRGTFDMDYLRGTVGPDLADVLLQGHYHSWTLTLYGVTCTNEYVEDPDYWYFEWTTRYYATSFDFQIDGPEADELNQIVSETLTQGAFADGAILELRHGDYWDDLFVIDYVPYHFFSVAISPADPTNGVSFEAESNWIPGKFEISSFGFPIATPQLDDHASTRIVDQRNGYAGDLLSIYEILSIDTPLPPPPAIPGLRIHDAAALEGNSKTSSLRLTVTLTSSSVNTVNVRYRTINGTASSKSDYTAVSQGTLSIPPGETRGTIAISVTGDRKREPDETFTVELFSAQNAAITDATATASILNDD